MANKEEVQESLKRIVCELKEIQRDVEVPVPGLPSVGQLDDIIYLLRDYIPEPGDEYVLSKKVMVRDVTILVFVKEESLGEDDDR